MALSKAKKSIPLYGGISDNVDSFLVPSPAVEYAENCHWRTKEGKLQKRLGSTKSTATGKPSAASTPTNLHPIDNKLYTFSDTDSYAYDVENDAWAATAQLPFTVDADVLSRSPRGTVHSFDHFYARDYASSSPRYGKSVVAFSQSPHGGTDQTIVIIYDVDGTVLTSGKTTGGSASIVPHVDGAMVVTYYNSNIYQTVVDLDDDTVGSASTLVSGNVFYGYHETFSSTPPGTTRPGFFLGAEECPALVTSGTLDNEFTSVGLWASVAYTNSSTGDLHILRTPDGSNYSTELIIPKVGSCCYPLAIVQHPNLLSYYILYSTHTSPGTNGVILREYANTQTNPASYMYTKTLATLGDEQPVNGTVTVRSTDDRPHYAWTSMPTWGAAAPCNTLYFGSQNNVLNEAVDNKELYGYRLSAKAFNSTEDDNVYIGAQLSPLPYVVSVTDITDPADNFAGWVFPTTNCVVNLTDEDNPAVVCGVDTNQSKQSDFTNFQNNKSLPCLGYTHTAGEVVFPSREIFTAESLLSIGSSAANKTVSKQTSADARVNTYGIQFTRDKELKGITLGDGVMLPGGAPMWFDGDVLCEHSPLGTPHITVMYDRRASDVIMTYGVLTKDDNGDTITPATLRKVQAVVGYTDSRGNEHRSAPSPVVYGVLAPHSDSTIDDYEQGIDLNVVVAAPITMNPQGNAGRYFCEIHISDSNTGTPRLAKRSYITADGSATGNYVDNTLSSTGTYTAATTAPAVRYTPFIYTNGGVLAADTFPNFTHGVATSTRVFAISKEDQGQVYYTKLFEEGVAPEFSAPLVVSLGDERKLTAIGKLDDKVIVFERDEMHAIYGPGPDNTGRSGRQGGFEVHHITSDVGCTDPESIVETKLGLIFRSRRGFYLLTRDSGLKFIGGPVVDITRNTEVLAAALVPEFAEVRFHMALQSGKTQVPEYGPDAYGSAVNTRPTAPKFGNTLPTDGCVVYNYEFDRWTVFSNYPSLASTLTADGRYARIDSDWDVYVESPEEDDHWLDGTTPYFMSILTPHIPLEESAVQGYARCRRATVLGRYMSSWAQDVSGNVMAGDLQVTTYSDYEPTASTTKLWRANKELQGGNDRFQIQLRPKKQKIQAIQFLIEEAATTAYTVPDDTYGPGRGFEIVAIDLDLGIKAGPVRTISGKRKA